MKKWLTLTNIMALLMIVLYIMDRWIIPIPENYNGFKWEDALYEAIEEDSLNEILENQADEFNSYKISSGYCGGVITNALGIIRQDINPNGHDIYRYVTCVFTHGFHLHLITNVIAFIIIGNFIEKRLGVIQMLGLFFLTNIIGILLTNFVLSNIASNVMATAGASAGIFGLFGIGFAMCLQNKENFKDFSILKKIYLIIYGVVPTYIISFGWTTAAHDFSFVIGIILGYILFFTIPKYKELVNSDKSTENN